MRTVVTGGTGHVGTNLVAALCADGYEVVVLSRREPRGGVRPGARWIGADVRDGGALQRAFAGADVVYHLAGVISVVGGMGGLVESVNVDGTRAVAQAALAAGVRRLVHCSSVHAYDLAGATGQVINESSPRALGPDTAAYDRSKARGEIEVRRVVECGLDAVVLNPTGIVGPVDEVPSRMGAVLLALWRRRLPAVVAGGFDWVDVRDVVAALRAAAERGRTGGNYLIPGHALAMSHLADLARECSGIAVTRWAVPAWTARLCSPLTTVAARRTGSPLLPTREALRALRAFPTIDGGKSARELGHRPRPIEQTVADLYAYFRRVGWV
jgi:dihydroflavonol-4-reductase